MKNKDILRLAATTVPRKECDGTWQDYRRHKRHKTPVCAASRKAWRTYIAQVRRNQAARGHEPPAR